MAQLINGKAIATHLQENMAERIKARRESGLSAPGLAVILIGNNPASQTYVRNKRLACERVGIISHAFDLPEKTTEQELIYLIDQLNLRPDIHGILVQLPLPMHINKDVILTAIDPEKDVDGFHPFNLGCLAQGRPNLRPCTPYGIMRMLEILNLPIIGQHAVIVGASVIVGRPMALEMLHAKATVTVCHSATKDLASFVKQADVLVSAIGNPDVIKADWIKPGAIVIDVGMNRSSSGKLIGDIPFEAAQEVAGWITPVPGGVGPMTVTMLLANTLQIAEKSIL